MKNKNQHIEEEEVNNPEQFQIGRANSSEKEHNDADESGYTPQENEFADGKGTQLNEELGEENFEQEAEEDTPQEEE